LAQFGLAQRLAAALDGSTGAVLEARSIRAQLKELTARASGSLAERIRSLDLQIAALLESADESAAPRRGLERLNDNFASLYAQVTGVDAAPTTVQAAETDLAIKEWQGLEAGWQHLRDDEVVALNRDLGKVRLPRLRSNLEPPRNLDFADEE
jgi:predicted negative regulator of RcsB-dependent stress response